MANIDYLLKPRLAGHRSRFEDFGFGSSAVPQFEPHGVRARRDYGAEPRVFDTRYGACALPGEISEGGYCTTVTMDRSSKGVGARVSVGKARVTGLRFADYLSEACLKRGGFQ